MIVWPVPTKSTSTLRKMRQGHAILRQHYPERPQYISWGFGRFCGLLSVSSQRLSPLCPRDTVLSIGFTRQERPGTNKVNNNNCYVRHLVAADECRVKFEPEFLCGGHIIGPPLDSSGMKDPRISRATEVWFPGSHSDMSVMLYFISMSHRF